MEVNEFHQSALSLITSKTPKLILFQSEWDSIQRISLEGRTKYHPKDGDKVLASNASDLDSVLKIIVKIFIWNNIYQRFIYKIIVEKFKFYQ